MDELNHNFGQLSTSAAEWKPAAAASSNSGAAAAAASSNTTPPPDSDLKASSVKEFVPGRGWVSEPPPQQNEQEGETNESVMVFDEFSCWCSCVSAGSLFISFGEFFRSKMCSYCSSGRATSLDVVWKDGCTS